MKSLISVTPREFKRNFNEVMEMYTDMCMTTNQEIIITVPTSRKSNTHAEIAKLIPVEGGIKYEYNKELISMALTLLILSFQKLELSWLMLLKKKEFTAL